MNAGDFNCAIDSAKAVLQMDAGNSAARELLERASAASQAQKQQALLASFDACLAADDANCVEDTLRRLSELSTASEVLADKRQLWVERQQQRARASTLADAQRCLDAGDWACVVDLAQPALQAQEDPELRALLVAAQTAQTESRQARARQQQLLEQAVARAEGCLMARDYACAEKHAEAAVATGIDPVRAQTLAQRVAFAQAEYASNLQKAKNVLAKGQACLQKKNYSCAIASSDSALEFVPDYPPALQLRASAQQAVERLKSQITIE